MPLYEYRCKKCEHLEEVLQKAKDPPPAKCPECGAKKSMEKEVSLTSFQLKGGGWYSDLYGSTKPDADKGADKGGDKSAKSESKSDKSEKTSDKKSKKSESKKSESKSKSKSPKGTKAA